MRIDPAPPLQSFINFRIISSGSRRESLSCLGRSGVEHFKQKRRIMTKHYHCVSALFNISAAAAVVLLVNNNCSCVMSQTTFQDCQDLFPTVFSSCEETEDILGCLQNEGAPRIDPNDNDNENFCQVSRFLKCPYIMECRNGCSKLEQYESCMATAGIQGSPGGLLVGDEGTAFAP